VSVHVLRDSSLRATEKKESEQKGKTRKVEILPIADVIPRYADATR